MPNLYVSLVVVEADSAEEATSRINEAAGPEPCNAHLVTDSIPVSRWLQTWLNPRPEGEEHLLAWADDGGCV